MHCNIPRMGIVNVSTCSPVPSWLLPFFSITLIFLNLFFLSPAQSAINFIEVTDTAGFTYSGETYGASWGDFDGDGYPDLWVNNHTVTPQLFLNNGNGVFDDVLLTNWVGDPLNDTHGAAWADFDNDGDQDLLSIGGAQQGQGQVPNQLFVNESGVLIDRAAQLGIEYATSRGRTGTWVDWNNDGLLDIIQSSERRPDTQSPSALFQQGLSGFQNTSADAGVGFDPKASIFTQISDLNGDGKPEFIVHSNTYPKRIYDTTQQPMKDLRFALGFGNTVSDVWDAAIADFNGDLNPDIFVTRVYDPRSSSDVQQVDQDTVYSRLTAQNDVLGMSFVADSNIVLDLYQFNISEVFIGSGGYHPGSLNFTLSNTAPANMGLAPYTVGVSKGLYIGYDEATSVWTIVLTSPSRKALNLIIDSNATISDLTIIGNAFTTPLADKYFVFESGKFVDQSDASGFAAPTSCLSATSGDFDNDGDLDLYLVCNIATANLPNILYENQGDGTFVNVPGAGGAEGSLSGRGENVAVADYDNDGFLDLFVTNGMYTTPFNGGPHQLFKNQGNANHWLKIDLEGVLSNRDGIGAKILLTSAGVVQMREKNGGIHRHAQDDQRIHFGLGASTVIERIDIQWPSGLTQILKNVSADQTIKIRENMGTVEISDAIVDERQGVLLFVVKLSEASAVPVEISFQTIDGSAVEGLDYVAQIGVLRFEPGEMEKTIEIPLIDDLLDEPDETFMVELTAGLNAVISQTQATVTVKRLPVWFDDVSSSAGLRYTGQTYGSSWGDFDNDGCTDIWVSNHYNRASVLWNQCNGTFIDVSTIFFDWIKNQDSHGAAWGDIDNDGDQDLIEVSGDNFNQVYINPNNQFKFITQVGGMGAAGCERFNPTCPLTRARTPTWLDWNHDGQLDLVVANLVFNSVPTILYEQSNQVFTPTAPDSGFDVVDSTEYVQIGHLNPLETPEIIVHDKKFPNRVFDISGVPMMDITNTIGMPVIDRVIDTAVADLDGDLDMDMILVRGEDKGDANQADIYNLALRLYGFNNERGVSFHSPGDLTFEIGPFRSNSKNIFIGKDGYQPDKTNFTLSSENPDNWGIQPHVAGAVDGNYVGYDPDTGRWTYLRSNVTEGYLVTGLSTSQPMSNIEYDNVQIYASSLSNAILSNTPGGFVSQSAELGLTATGSCQSVVAEDFDNDMDVDLYMVCNRPAGNVNNRIYLNQDGVFEEINLSAGAPGSVYGRGDAVTSGDMDNDGWMDVFLTNSDLTKPLLGPHQLYRNMTNNGNHWLQVDLEGVVSNRDGTGASLEVWIRRDGVRQIRTQDGGMHRHSQNDRRVHFGLAGNERVSELVINWPSGNRQVIKSIVADQIIKVTESVNTDPVGEPIVTYGEDVGVFIWKDAGTNQYHLRTSSDGSQKRFTVRLISSEPLISVNAVSLEFNDTLSQTPYGFTLQSLVSVVEDGLDFTVAPGSKTLFSVEQEQNVNPRLLHVGDSGLPLTPVGYIIPNSDFKLIPAFDDASSLGLFIGRGMGEKIEVRWTGSTIGRNYQLDIFSSHDITSITAVSLEAADVVSTSAHWINIDGRLGPLNDGVDIMPLTESDLGLVYQQDDFPTPDRIDAGHTKLGFPNAYWLP